MHSGFSSLSHNTCIAPIAAEFITFSLSSELPVNLLQSLGVCAYGQLANCSSDCLWKHWQKGFLQGGNTPER